jgi:transposase
MIAFSSAQRYFFYQEAADMRKGFDGLSALVSNALKRDPQSGDVFVFINRRRTHIKLLVWDRSGFALFYKRLERGTFEIPQTQQLSWHHLILMLEGISLKTVRYRKRYSAPEKDKISA